MNFNEKTNRMSNTIEQKIEDTTCQTCGIPAELVDVLRHQQQEDGYTISRLTTRLRSAETANGRLEKELREITALAKTAIDLRNGLCLHDYVCDCYEQAMTELEAALNIETCEEGNEYLTENPDSIAY